MIPKNPEEKPKPKKDTSGQKRRNARSGSNARGRSRQTPKQEPKQEAKKEVKKQTAKPAKPEPASVRQPSRKEASAKKTAQKAEVRTYRAKANAHADLKPQKVRADEKKQGFFRTLFRKTSD